jgi:DNA-binding NarL/FixJ family response regulator
LSVTESERTVIDCAEAGVAAYVMRDESIEQLVETLAGVARREARCSPRLAGMLLRRVTELAANGHVPERPGEPPLTQREREVLGLLADGLTNKQIAHRLSIEMPTVKNHVHSILGKLDVHRRTEAVAWLHRWH